MFRRTANHRSSLKLIGYEDILIGIVLGVFMIAYSNLFFTIPNIKVLLPITLGLFIILALLDIVHELKTMMHDFFFTILALISNAIEIFISLVFISKLGYLTLPYITEYTPYLEAPTNIFFAGLFIVLVNIFWFYAYHFMR